MSRLGKLKSLAQRLVFDRQGPLTRDLLLTPGQFGLGKVPQRLKPDGATNMVCGYCSTGCSLKVHLKDGAPINLSPNGPYPVNIGMACPKGWQALEPLRAKDRATQPLLRNDRGKLVPVTWEEAAQTFAARFKTIQAQYGKESVAFISTGQIVTEEMFLLGALAKFGMGMLEGDGNTRQCMATAVVAYKQAFGFDAPPYTYQDFEESDVIVLVGSNLGIAHPIMWERVCRNQRKPAIIVVDPRKTETAMSATHHLALRPKSDLTLFYGLANLLLTNNWMDRAFVDAHTKGLEEMRAHVAPFTPARVAAETGISEERLREIAQLIRPGKRVSFWWTMGVNQSHEAVRTAQAIINLALLGGHIGKPGTGANSITGQCNAMGSRLFSNTTNLLGGHDFALPEHRQKVADVLSIDEALIPRRASLAYEQILEKALSGGIRGLWIVATNPAHSWINQNFFKEVAERLEFLVVQDMYATTETAQLAHLVLPAAGWGEKEGTFINSERRIGLVKRVAKPPGQAMSDFNIFRLMADAWGCGDMFADMKTPEAVFQKMKACSAGQPCDITGIEDYRMLEREGGVQWPHPAGAPPPAQQRRLFEDGRFFHKDGKAVFHFEEPRPVAEPTNARFPLVLLTGRGSSSQWHTQTRTQKSAVLRLLYPKDVYVEINPVDAGALKIAPSQWVYVSSQRATIRARAYVTNNVQPGQVFIPMHYETANQLTFASFDPYSHQPSYKHCAVAVRLIEHEEHEREPAPAEPPEWGKRTLPSPPGAPG
jgi:assimilatory nitrate reductase catalytic subunit